MTKQKALLLGMLCGVLALILFWCQMYVFVTFFIDLWIMCGSVLGICIIAYWIISHDDNRLKIINSLFMLVGLGLGFILALYLSLYLAAA